MQGHDLVPEPKIIIAALRACRRVNDYALAVRLLEAIKVLRNIYCLKPLDRRTDRYRHRQVQKYLWFEITRQTDRQIETQTGTEIFNV